MHASLNSINSLWTAIISLPQHKLTESAFAQLLVEKIKALGANWQHQLATLLSEKLFAEEIEANNCKKAVGVACLFFEKPKIREILFKFFRIHACDRTELFSSIADELAVFGDQQEVSNLFAEYFDKAQCYDELIPFMIVLAPRIEESAIGDRFELLYKTSEFAIRRELITALQRAQQTARAQLLVHRALKDTHTQVRNAAIDVFLSWNTRHNLCGIIQLFNQHCARFAQQRQDRSVEICVKLLTALGPLLLNSNAWFKVLRCLVLHQHHDLKAVIAELEAEMSVVKQLPQPTMLQQLNNWLAAITKPHLKGADFVQFQIDADQLAEAAMRIVGNLLPDPRALELIEKAVQHNDGARISTAVYLDAFRGRSTDPSIRAWLLKACQMNSSLGLVVAAMSLSESLDTATLNPVVDVACRFDGYRQQDDIVQAVANNCDEKIQEMLSSILQENETSRRTSFAIRVLIALHQPQPAPV